MEPGPPTGAGSPPGATTAQPSLRRLALVSLAWAILAVLVAVWFGSGAAVVVAVGGSVTAHLALQRASHGGERGTLPARVALTICYPLVAWGVVDRLFLTG